MPLCTLKTNLPESKLPQNFESDLAAQVAAILEKPMEKVIVHVEPGAKIRRGGDKDEPVVWLNIHTIGRFTETSNPEYGPPMKKYIAATLSLDEKRVVVSLQDLPAANLF